MSMAQQYTKPLPVPDADSKPFWDYCKQHEFRVQRCTDCETYRFHPSPICHNCNSWSYEWAKMSGKGTVYSWIVVQQPVIPNFDVPYVGALIALEEQSDCRILSNVVECDPHAVYNNMPVEVVFDDINEEITLPKFRPALERDRREAKEGG